MWTTGGNLVNQGSVDGGSNLQLFAARVNGGGAFRGNAMVIATFGNLNNPVNGAHFPANGLQLFPGSGSQINLTLAGYGPAPQFMNLLLNGDATLAMPSAWPGGSTLPPNNRPVMPNETRAAGVPDPAYGGGSIIVQATGTLALQGGRQRRLHLPGRRGAEVRRRAGRQRHRAGQRLDHGGHAVPGGVHGGAEHHRQQRRRADRGAHQQPQLGQLQRPAAGAGGHLDAAAAARRLGAVRQRHRRRAASELLRAAHRGRRGRTVLGLPDQHPDHGFLGRA